MIIELFLTIFAVGIFFMFYGEYTREIAWIVSGCSIVFLLSAWILFGQYTGYSTVGLEYRSGDVTTIDNSNPALVIETKVFSYSSYSDQTTFWVGFFAATISGLGIILAFIPKREKK